MSVYRVSPTSLAITSGTWSGSEAAMLALLSDGSGGAASLIENSTVPASLRLGFPGVSPVPPTEFISGVRLYVRHLTYPDARWTATVQQTYGAITASGCTITQGVPVVSAVEKDDYSSYAGSIVTGWSALNNGQSLDKAWAGTTAQISVTAGGAGFSLFSEVALFVQTQAIPFAPYIAGDNTNANLTITDTLAPKIQVTDSTDRYVTVTQRSRTGFAATLTVGAGHGFVVGQSLTLFAGDATYNSAVKVTGTTATTITYTTTTSRNDALAAVTGWSIYFGGGTSDRYMARLFSSAQYGASGFSPDTSAGVFSIGTRTATFGTSVQLPTLVNGASYRLYCRTGINTAGGIAYGPWGYRTITLSVPAVTPTLTGSWSAGTQAATIAVACRSNLLPQALAENGGTAGLVGTASTLATLTSDSFTGSSGCVEMTGTATGTISTVLATAYAPNAVAGQAYVASVKVKPTISARQVRLDLIFYDATDAVLTTTSSGLYTASLGGWTSPVATATAPVNTDKVSLQVTMLGTTAVGEKLRIDRACIQPGTVESFTNGVPFTWVRSSPSVVPVTWQAIVTRTAPDGTVASVGTFPLSQAQIGTVTDYTTPRGATCTYGVTVVGVDPTGATSARSESLPATQSIVSTSDGRWWVKPQGRADLNVGGVGVKKGSVTEVIDEPVGVHRPLGRSLPLVTSGVLGGLDGSLTFITSTVNQWESLIAALRAQVPVLLQEPFADSAGVGLQRLVRITSAREITRTGTVREVGVSFVEVTS